MRIWSRAWTSSRKPPWRWPARPLLTERWPDGDRPFRHLPKGADRTKPVSRGRPAAADVFQQTEFKEISTVIVKKLADIIGTEDDVDTEGWNSRRLLLKDDGMGYSVHDTIIKEGAELYMHYKNHLEAVYLIEGKGEIETVDDGRVYPLEAFTIYAWISTTSTYCAPTRARTCAWCACSIRRFPDARFTAPMAPTRPIWTDSPRTFSQAPAARICAAGFFVGLLLRRVRRTRQASRAA